MNFSFRPKSDARIYKQMGYFKDSDGIIQRYSREKLNWDKHLEHTKKAILKATEKAKNNDTLYILGSGWLLDVPINELLLKFNKIILTDIKHPLPVKHKYKNNQKIIFQEIDISQLATTIYKAAKDGSLSAEQINRIIQKKLDPSALYTFGKPDFVVSINLLNQLDILLFDYIARFYKFSEQQELFFRNQVQRSHLEILPTQKSCLITDFQQTSYNEKNEIIEKKQLVFLDIKSKTIKNWKWIFDTQKKYDNHHKVIFDVAWIELK